MASNQQVNIGVNTQGAEQDLADFAKHVNDFLSAKGAAAGKSPRLLDTAADKAALQELKKQMQEVINISATLRGPLNSAGQGGANRPTTPGQINLSGISQTLAGQQRFMEHFMTRLLTHNANTSATPLNTGLNYQELTGRTGGHVQPPGQSQNQAHDQLFKGSGAAGHLARQVSPLLGGAGGALGQAASIGAAGYAGRGMAGFAGGGMAGLAAGAGIGLLGYGLYKGASAVNEGVDREKVLNTDIDKFRRSLGVSAESFDDLVSHSRDIGDAFGLVYSESRKISTEFANIARTNVGAVGQASEGVGLAQSVGIDPSQGSGFMANLRKSQSIGEKTSDARIMAIQFSEALKRTGSTLNAGELMTAIQGFSTDTAHRGLAAANVEGYAGILSAMVGLGVPGLDVGNASGILAQADAAFRSGGGGGQAGNTLQYMALGGDAIGLTGVEMREAAGLASTADEVYSENAPYNRLAASKGETGIIRKGSTTALEELVDFITKKENSGGSTELEVRALGKILNNDPNKAAVLMMMAKKGKLGDTLGLMKANGVGINDVSMDGVNTFTAISDAKGDTDKLREIEAGMGRRADLSPTQTGQLAKMKGLTGPDLQKALMDFAKTMQRENNTGSVLEIAANKTANATDMIGSKLIPAVEEGNKLLAALVTTLAPNTEMGKELAQKRAERRVEQVRAAVESGEIGAGYVDTTNGRYNDSAADLAGKGASRKDRVALAAKQIRELGSKAVAYKDTDRRHPEKAEEAAAIWAEAQALVNGAGAVGVVPEGSWGSGVVPEVNPASKPTQTAGAGVVTPEMRAKMLANDAELAKVHPGWAPGMTEAQIRQESNFNPSALSSAGAQGYTQIMPGTRKLFEKREGRKFEAGNFDDDLALHKLHMTDDLRREKNVPDALRAYNGSPNFRNSNSRENREYAEGVVSKHAALPPEAKAAQIPANDPAKSAAAAAEAQRLHVTVGDQKSSVTVNLVGAPGSGQPDQTVTSSGTAKPQASGSVKSSDPLRYRA